MEESTSVGRKIESGFMFEDLVIRNEFQAVAGSYFFLSGSLKFLAKSWFLDLDYGASLT